MWLESRGYTFATIPWAEPECNPATIPHCVREDKRTGKTARDDRLRDGGLKGRCLGWGSWARRD